MNIRHEVAVGEQMDTDGPWVFAFNGSMAKMHSLETSKAQHFALDVATEYHIRSVRVDMARPQFDSLVTAIKHAADVSSQMAVASLATKK